MTAHTSSARRRRGFRGVHLRVALMLCAMLSPQSAAPQARPQDSRPTEYEVEAAYLSNFGRFVEWPQKPVAGDPFNVCVYGADPFGPLLDAALRGESISGAPLTPRRLAALEDVAGCRILFIGQARENQSGAALAGLRNPGVLTVSDSPGFARRGGMIEFVLEGNRVRFEINLTAAQRAGLVLSSQLLKLAVTVRRSP